MSLVLRGLIRQRGVGVLLEHAHSSGPKYFCSNTNLDRSSDNFKPVKNAPPTSSTKDPIHDQQQRRVDKPSDASPPTVADNQSKATTSSQSQSQLPSANRTTTLGTKSAAAKTYSPQQIRKNVRSYVFSRYINYIKNYDEVLEKKFPAAMKVYRVFAVGIKDFYNDMKLFLKISRIVNTTTQGLRSLTRRELELYYQMPKDMLRVAPVLALSALPFANYVIFPVAYMFPKQFLSPHFWSIQQRFKFTTDMLQDRLYHQRSVFRFMQSRLELLREDEVAFRQMRLVLGRLGAGQHPSVEDVVALTAVMSRPPYNLESLPQNVLSHLCGLHGIHRGIGKRSRLAYHAYLIHHMDLAIRREGGVHNMPLDSLVRACAIRGLNTSNISNEAMIDWLRQWVSVSVPVQGESVSLFLFLPIFIAYNHPNNWRLLHSK